MLKSKSTILLLILELVSFLFFVVESFTVWNPTTKGLKGQQSCRSESCLHYSLFPEEEEEEEDDDEFIDTDSLGDWRTFRRNLTFEEPEKQQQEKDEEAVKERRPKSVSKENEQILLSQNEELAREYITGVWAHEVAQPEVGGLVVRMPLEAEIYKNYKHSVIGSRLRKKLISDDESEDEKNFRPAKEWYGTAKSLIEDEMKKIANSADDEGQIDATRLKDDSSEMLSLFLDNQENWQEVCLVVEQEDGSSSKTKTLVLNRPMAFQLTDNIGRLVLNGAFQTGSDVKDMPIADRKDLMRFMMAFSSECAVYVGGPDDQNNPAIMIHGIPDLPGAVEISPGSKIYQGGIEAAVKGVLDGEYSPLEFRFFVGCHSYEESALDVAVHLGKYQPVACARSVALKQCISLPKPLWHEVMELCGGDFQDLSLLESSKSGDIQFQVVDETDYDDEIPDELGELENFDDDDDDSYL